MSKDSALFLNYIDALVTYEKIHYFYFCDHDADKSQYYLGKSCAVSDLFDSYVFEYFLDGDAAKYDAYCQLMYGIKCTVRDGVISAYNSKSSVWDYVDTSALWRKFIAGLRELVS